MRHPKEKRGRAFTEPQQEATATGSDSQRKLWSSAQGHSHQHTQLI